jgi:hypothetical protein
MFTNLTAANLTGVVPALNSVSTKQEENCLLTSSYYRSGWLEQTENN